MLIWSGHWNASPPPFTLFLMGDSCSKDVEHNRKNCPALWNTQVQSWDYTLNIEKTKWKHSNFHQQF
jgi:hypothetical protein